MSTIRAIVEVISLTASQPVRRIIVRPAATINTGGGGGGGPVDWSEVENKPRVLYVVTTPYPDEDANNYEVGDVALFTYELGVGAFLRVVISSDTPGVNEWDDIGRLVPPFS